MHDPDRGDYKKIDVGEDLGVGSIASLGNASIDADDIAGRDITHVGKVHHGSSQIIHINLDKFKEEDYGKIIEELIEQINRTNRASRRQADASTQICKTHSITIQRISRTLDIIMAELYGSRDKPNGMVGWKNRAKNQLRLQNIAIIMILLGSGIGMCFGSIITVFILTSIM